MVEGAPNLLDVLLLEGASQTSGVENVARKPIVSQSRKDSRKFAGVGDARFGSKQLSDGVQERALYDRGGMRDDVQCDISLARRQERRQTCPDRITRTDFDDDVADRIDTGSRDHPQVPEPNSIAIPRSRRAAGAAAPVDGRNEAFESADDEPKV
jgi:hypothetical protein